MSFNDLERGTGSPASRGGYGDHGVEGRGGGGGLNGQSYHRNSNRLNNNRGAASARGPLPLYHAPPSSSSSHHANDGYVTGGEQGVKPTDHEWKKLADRIGIQIFKLNSNIQGIDKLMELQTRKIRSSKSNRQEGEATDKDWMAQIHELTETTRALVKDLSTAFKTFSMHRPDQMSSADRFTTAKLQREFETAINSFARSQRESAKMSRNMLIGAKEERERAVRAVESSDIANKIAVNETLIQVDNTQQNEQVQEQQQHQHQQQQQQQVSAGPSMAEIEFQETLIAERESEIREIESGIHELNEIFRDLGHIVQEQGGMIDNIEYNVSTIATNTSAADRELVTASDYQRRAGRRAACLLLVVGFVIAVVLLAILS